MAWQVFTLALFSLLSFEFWMQVRDKKQTTPLNPAFADLRARRGFQPSFIVAVFVAGGFIFVRSVFRCAEQLERGSRSHASLKGRQLKPLEPFGVPFIELSIEADRQS